MDPVPHVPKRAEPRRGRRGAAFSLLEVMVAVSILGLALTVILSAQGGLAASNKSAGNMGQATSLGRCKMTEMEEKLLKLGYPELDQLDSAVSCCEGTEGNGFLCDIRVEKVVLPNPPDNSLGDGGFLASPSPSGSSAGIAPGLAGNLPTLPGAGNNPAGTGQLDLDGGLQNIGSQIQQQLGAAGPGGSAGLLTMVMGIVYPSLKPMMENSIRRLTVTIKWKEGPNPKELGLVQYVTNPTRGGFLNGVLPGADGGAGAAGLGGPGPSPTPAGPGGAAPNVRAPGL